MNNTQLKEFTKTKTGNYVVPIEDACEKDGKYTEAYPIGFPVFDNAMKVGKEKEGGVRAGDLIIITGISGSGKTTFAQNITKNLGSLPVVPTLWFSYEVMIDNLYAKFIDMGITKDTLIYTPKKNISGNLKWIKEKIKEAIDKYSVKVIIIDHIDFLSPTELKSSDQRRLVLRDICQELKILAIDLEVSIFLMAHTKKVQNREVEMQDIAESSGIYQLADYVFSVGRHYRVETRNGREIKTAIDEGIVKILKNRLTGSQPFMNFKLENNIIKEISNEPIPTNNYNSRK